MSNKRDEESAPPSDEEVLAAKGVTVTLCGREYTWPEPSRRVAREMRAAIAEMKSVEALAKYRGMTKAQVDEAATPQDVAASHRFINEMLDFFYAFHSGMEQDRELLDDADDKEIAQGFAAVKEMLDRPFRNAVTRQVGKMTRTLKASSTKR